MRSYSLLVLLYHMLIFCSCTPAFATVVEPLEQAESGKQLYQLRGGMQDAEKHLMVCSDSLSLLTRSEAYACLPELHIKSAKRALHGIYLLILLLFSGGLCLLYQKYRHTTLHMRSIQKTLVKDEKQIAFLKSEIEAYKMRQTESNIQMGGYEELQEQLVTLTTENEEFREKTDVGMLIETLKQGAILTEYLTSKEWDEIFKLANSLYFNSIDFVKSEYSHLTKHDIELLSFLLLGFSTKELTILFDSKDDHTIFKAKSRLKGRLRLTKQENLDDFLQNCREGKFK